MSETQTPDKKPFRLTGKGVAVVAGVSALAGSAAGYGAHEAVDAAQRIFNPEAGVTAEAAPVPIDIQEFQAKLDALRKDGIGNSLHLVSTTTVEQGTSLYEDGLALATQIMPPDEFEQNRANIQESLLESGKTANTDQPETPYITHPGQVYGYYWVDINEDGFNELVTSLIPADEVANIQLPTLSQENKD